MVEDPVAVSTIADLLALGVVSTKPPAEAERDEKIAMKGIKRGRAARMTPKAD